MLPSTQEVCENRQVSRLNTDRKEVTSAIYSVGGIRGRHARLEEGRGGPESRSALFEHSVVHRRHHGRFRPGA